ncbi:hypothetical protein ACFL0V_04125 [Nanoarchaeota archaeon]
MSRLIVPGMGNCFTRKYNHPCFIFNHGAKFYVIDVPGNFPKMLECQRQSVSGNGEIDERVARFLTKNLVMDKMLRYFFTHSHQDHAGGLETVGFLQFYEGGRRSRRLDKHKINPKLPDGRPKPRMVTRPEVYSQLEQMTLFKMNASELFEGELQMSDYYRRSIAQPGDVVHLDPGVDVMITGASHAVPACGFLFMYEEDGQKKKIWFTGDTRVPEGFIEEYGDCDLIVGDCSAFRAGGHGVDEDYMRVDPEIRENVRVYHVADRLIEKRMEPEDRDGEEVLVENWYVAGTEERMRSGKVKPGSGLKVLKQYSVNEI